MAELLGRICVKLLGREAGKTCVIADELEGNFVLIDGNVRRRKCNLDHLEISENLLKIKKNASTSEIQAAMKDAGIKIVERKKASDKKVLKPKKIRKKKAKTSNETSKKLSTKKADGSQNRNSK